MPPKKKRDYEALGRELRKLPVFQMIKNNQLHMIERETSDQMFKLLDTNKSGELSRDDLQALRYVPGCPLSDMELDDIIAQGDRNGNGILSEDEFYHALTNGKSAFKRLVAGIKGIQLSGKAEEVARQDLMNFLKWEFNKRDSCFSLPFTIFFFVVFVILVGIHARTEDSYLLQVTIDGEISGEGGRDNDVGPFLFRDIHDVPTYWQWFETSWLSATNRQDLHAFPVPGRVAHYNQIVGAQRIRKVQSESVACKQTSVLQDLYGSTDPSVLTVDGRPLGCASTLITEFSAADDQYFLYHLDRSVLQEKVEQLKSELWINNDTPLVRHELVLYNAEVGAFTHVYLDFDFRRVGEVFIKYSMETFDSDPLFSWESMIADIIYFMLIAKMAYSEGSELVPAAQNGWDGLMDYISFWNVVDWISIFCGAAVQAMWFIFVYEIYNDLLPAIDDLDADALDRAVAAKGGYLTEAEFSQAFGGNVTLPVFQELAGQIFVSAETCRSLIFSIRVLIAGNVVILMFRFFKAFRANPRLNVVTMTLVDGSVDIAHFGVVFSVIFVSFSAMGAVLFGPRMEIFKSISKSLNTGFEVLMGDFDFEGMERVSWVFATLWFWSFQLLTTQVLLNMLLAIIMDTYAVVKGREADGSDTIVRQAFLTYKMMQETKGHMDIYFMFVEMEDDDNPAHPDAIVTVKSLRRAFGSKMTRANAEWLIHHCQDYLARNKDGQITLTDGVRLMVRVEQKETNTHRLVSRVIEYLDALHRKAQKEMERAKKAMRRLKKQSGGVMLTGGGAQSALMMRNGNSAPIAKSVKKKELTQGQQLPGMVPETSEIEDRMERKRPQPLTDTGSNEGKRPGTGNASQESTEDDGNSRPPSAAPSVKSVLKKKSSFFAPPTDAEQEVEREQKRLEREDRLEICLHCGNEFDPEENPEFDGQCPECTLNEMTSSSESEDEQVREIREKLDALLTFMSDRDQWLDGRLDALEFKAENAALYCDKLDEALELPRSVKRDLATNLKETETLVNDAAVGVKRALIRANKTLAAAQEKTTRLQRSSALNSSLQVAAHKLRTSLGKVADRVDRLEQNPPAPVPDRRQKVDLVALAARKAREANRVL